MGMEEGREPWMIRTSAWGSELVLSLWHVCASTAVLNVDALPDWHISALSLHSSSALFRFVVSDNYFRLGLLVLDFGFKEEN
jgi:hypothetical protein